MQAARTRSFAILCNLVMNATCDRCVWYVDCSSDRVLSVAVQCYVVTSLSAPGEHPSRRPASPSVAEGAVGRTTVKRSLGAGRNFGFACQLIGLALLPRRRCVKSSDSAQLRPLLQSYPSTSEAEPAENCSHAAHLCQPGPASHRSTRRRPAAPQAEPAPETWRAHDKRRLRKKNGHAQPARRRRPKTHRCLGRVF